MCALCLWCAVPTSAFVQQQPADPLPRQRSAIRDLILDGRAKSALERIVALRQQHQTDAGLALLEGEALYALGLLDQAVATFRRGLQLDPTMQGKLFNLGRALQELGDDREALQVFQRMQSRPEPSHRTRGLFGAGLSWQHLGDDSKARLLYQQALQLEPTFDRARYRLALLDLEASPEQALAMLDELLLRDPLHHGASYNRALALRNLGRGDDAREAMKRYRTVLDGRSRIALVKERWASKPTDLELVLELARLYRQFGVTDEALMWCSRGGRLAPDDPRPALEAVETMLAAGLREEAGKLAEQLRGSGAGEKALEALRRFDASEKSEP